MKLSELVSTFTFAKSGTLKPFTLVGAYTHIFRFNIILSPFLVKLKFPANKKPVPFQKEHQTSFQESVPMLCYRTTGQAAYLCTALLSDGIETGSDMRRWSHSKRKRHTPIPKKATANAAKAPTLGSTSSSPYPLSPTNPGKHPRPKHEVSRGQLSAATRA